MAVVIPEEDAVRAWCKQNGIKVDSLHDLYKHNAKLKEHIVDQMNEEAKSAGLKSFEQVTTK